MTERKNVEKANNGQHTTQKAQYSHWQYKTIILNSENSKVKETLGKPNGQSRMDNPETLTTLDTQDPGQRLIKQKKKTKREKHKHNKDINSNTDLTKKRRWTQLLARIWFDGLLFFLQKSFKNICDVKMIVNIRKLSLQVNKPDQR